jgi:hypothetical protein
VVSYPDTIKASFTVGVAQLVERWIVVPVAEGSNPSTHPKDSKALACGIAESPIANFIVILPLI